MRHENSWAEFRDILYCGDDLKYVDSFQFFLKSDEINGLLNAVLRNGFRGKQGERGLTRQNCCAMLTFHNFSFKQLHCTSINVQLNLFLIKPLYPLLRLAIFMFTLYIQNSVFTRLCLRPFVGNNACFM
jgi:hypothetical protein